MFLGILGLFQNLPLPIVRSGELGRLTIGKTPYDQVLAEMAPTVFLG